MATYVIGDLQGCFDSLIALLNAVNFDDEVHQTLQKKVRKSPLCDSELFAKNFEKSMWQIWNEFLEKNQQNQQK